MHVRGIGIWRAALLGTWVIAFGACDVGNRIAPGTADGGESASADAGSLPSMGGGGAPDCQNGCCPLPQLGATCAAADEGKTCSSSEQCVGGLLLPQQLECDGGTWTTQAACNADGGVATNGCPTSQPTDGDSCGLPDGTSCQYALVCPSTCDAGPGMACATASKVGPARCESGTWHTTPLGACP